MQIDVYTLLVPQLQRSLVALKNCLAKGESFAQSKKIDPAVLLNSRLAPDQFPLLKQIQISCDTAKFLAARLSGTQAPKHEDNEVTLKDCYARIDSTLNFLSTVPADSFANYTEKEIRFPWNPGKKISGTVYLSQYGLPNFYFHITTAYAILRHNGVGLGKADYLGAVEWQND